MGQPHWLKTSDYSFIGLEQTPGTETSQYRQEKEITMIPQVVASERGGAQTTAVTAAVGL